MKKILLALLAVPLIAFGQTYPSPTFSSLTLQNPLTAANGGTGTTTSTGTGSVVYASSPTISTPTVTGSFTATGLVTLADLATQAANTVLANATASSASPTAFAMPGCSAATNALTWTTSTGFTCNSAINASTLGGTTFAAPGPIGSTTPSTGAFTTLSASSAVSGAGFSTYLASPPAIGGTVANAGSFTTLSASTANPSLNYLANGTGATSRSYSSKFGDVVSVKDFGAVGNGSADDSAAVAATITYACSKAPQTPRVYFPAGNYLVATGNITYCNGLHLWGDGQTATTISTNSTTGNLLSDSNTTGTGIHNVAIAYNNTPTAGYALSLTNTVISFTAENVRIVGAFGGINLSAIGVQQAFSNIDIYGTQTNGVGIYLNNADGPNITNLLIYSPLTSPSAGIQIQTAGGMFLDGADIVHTQRALLINPGSGQSVNWLSIVNSDFDTCSVHCIDIIPSSGGTVYGLTFVGTWASSATNVGTYLEGAGTISGVRFVGHRGFNSGQDGMIISNGTNVSVSDSDFSGNSQSSSGTYNGITVGAGVGYFSLIGNRIGQMGPYANTQKYGIAVTAGSSNFYMITNNNTQGNGTGGINDGGTGGTKVVTNNL